MQITVNKYFDSCCKLNFKLFILTGARCCPAHIVNDIINTESIENLVPPWFCQQDHYHGTCRTAQRRGPTKRIQENRFWWPFIIVRQGLSYIDWAKEVRLWWLAIACSIGRHKTIKDKNCENLLSNFSDQNEDSLDNNMLGVLFNMSKPQVGEKPSYYN